MTTARNPMTVSQYHERMEKILNDIGENNIRAELSEDPEAKDVVDQLKLAIKTGKDFEPTSGLGSFGLLSKMGHRAEYMTNFLRNFSVSGPNTEKLAKQLVDLSKEGWPEKGVGTVADPKGNSVFRFGFEHNRSHNNTTAKVQREILERKLNDYYHPERKEMLRRLK